jgi:hypothetical protein
VTRGAATWAYVQARLQTRHGDRLQDSDWQALSATRSAERYLERSRSTPMRRFTEHVNAQMESHAMERALRSDCRVLVSEVASWVPKEWRAAVIWTAHFPDLPVLGHLIDGKTPAWAEADPVYAPFAEADAAGLRERLAGSPLRALVPSADEDSTIAERWLAHWRSLWPPLGDTERKPLERLIAIVARHFEQLGHTRPPDSSERYRAELMQDLIRIFRRHSATPAAMFAELALLALDLERLRGGLVRRRLFAVQGSLAGATDNARGAA